MIEAIQKITDAELKFISELDYGKKSEEHYRGLKQVIYQQECIIDLSTLYRTPDYTTFCIAS